MPQAGWLEGLPFPGPAHCRSLPNPQVLPPPQRGHPRPCRHRRGLLPRPGCQLHLWFGLDRHPHGRCCFVRCCCCRLWSLTLEALSLPAERKLGPWSEIVRWRRTLLLTWRPRPLLCSCIAGGRHRKHNCDQLDDKRRRVRLGAPVHTLNVDCMYSMV